MKQLNIVVEGNCEESFVNDVLSKHLINFKISACARRIRTGWDSYGNKPAKGGLLKYIKFKNDILNWIQSDRGRPNTWYTSMLDLYAFPKDTLSPYSMTIQAITDPYQRISALESAIKADINHPKFIPYIQLHEFEAFLLVDPDKLLVMYPDGQTSIERLKRDIAGREPEKVNESQHTAPSKRIIKHIEAYEGQKAQVGPLVAEDIGLIKLREKCPHFNDWVTKLENL